LQAVSQAVEALSAASGTGASKEALQLKAVMMFNRSVELQTGGIQWTRGELLGRWIREGCLVQTLLKSVNVPASAVDLAWGNLERGITTLCAVSRVKNMWQGSAVIRLALGMLGCMSTGHGSFITAGRSGLVDDITTELQDYLCCLLLPVHLCFPCR
jgi:hypothetical protein